MKRAVSISIGSSKRDKTVEIDLLGERVHLQRIGTDGDMKKAARLYRELDGKVDALGVGGTDLGLLVGSRFYPLYSVAHLVADVKHTPVVDGSGLKATLERKAAQVVEEKLGAYIPEKKALVTTATDRWGMASGFVEAGYTMIFGDLIFSIGIPIALRSQKAVMRMASLLMPVMGRIPFEWLYPVGQAQEKRTPRAERYFHWANVVLGDCHYVRRYMPERIPGKIIVTNTTTPEDTRTFAEAGVRYLVTTTPVLDGRSFGTNLMEAALVAATGRREPVNYARPGGYFQWMADLVDRLDMKPQVHLL